MDMDGELRTFSEFQGGPLLVMGTAAWCPSCDGLLFSLHEWSTTEAPEELSTKVANLAIVGKDAAGRGAEKAKQMAQKSVSDLQSARIGH